jgi:hypothetical protein
MELKESQTSAAAKWSAIWGYRTHVDTQNQEKKRLECQELYLFIQQVA